MRIELDSLTTGKTLFTHAYAPGELEFSDERVRLCGAPEVSGTLLLKGKRALVQGRLSANTEVDCDRCLSLVAIPIEAQFSVQYVTRLEYESSQAVALEEEDMAFSVFDDQAIDIDQLVREQVLLTVPVRALCREDCKGLCPSCGADQNMNKCSCESTEIDPRWAVLKNLRS